MRKYPGHNGSIIIMVVSTDSYAGNYYRQFCAYVTGQIGECETGDREAECFVEDEGLELKEEIEQYIMQMSDDHGMDHPASMRVTPKDAPNYKEVMSSYNDVPYALPCHNDIEIFFSKIPPTHILEVMARRAKEFCDRKKFQFYGIDFYEEVVKVETVKIQNIKWKSDVIE